jgi:fido (protein-threonine AMPylation protein)
MAGKNQILVCEDTFREICHLVPERKIAHPFLKGMERRIDVYEIINAS